MNTRRVAVGSLVTVIGAVGTYNFFVSPDAGISDWLFKALPQLVWFPLFFLGPALLAGGVAILVTARSASATRVESGRSSRVLSAGAIIRIGLGLIAIVALFNFVATMARLDQGGVVSWAMTLSLFFVGFPGVVLALVGTVLWVVGKLRRDKPEQPGEPT